MSRGRNFVRLHRRTTQFIFLAPCKLPLGHRGGFGDEVLNTNHQPTKPLWHRQQLIFFLATNVTAGDV